MQDQVIGVLTDIKKMVTKLEDDIREKQKNVMQAKAQKVDLFFVNIYYSNIQFRRTLRKKKKN